MEKRNRITNILIASTLTILLLAIFLVFRGSNHTTALETGNTTDTGIVEIVGDYETDIANLQAQVESLQEQNAAYAEQNEELRAAVITMQERENEYQAQMEAANQTINELSTQTRSLALTDQDLGSFGRRPHEHNH